MVSMAAVRSDLESTGWSRQSGTLEEARREARIHGLLSAAGGLRLNERVLVPYEATKAPRHSLSAVYGLGEQPLHSDGAHHRLPPDVVVLHSAAPTPTSTVIWTPSYSDVVLYRVAREGIFTVRGNEESFLAVAHDTKGLRFDPVVMSPGDAFARETAAYFEAARSLLMCGRWSLRKLNEPAGYPDRPRKTPGSRNVAGGSGCTRKSPQPHPDARLLLGSARRFEGSWRDLVRP
jgi:hypothetical protein